jgi:hypothetical protein
MYGAFWPEPESNLLFLVPLFPGEWYGLRSLEGYVAGLSIFWI